MTHLPPPPDHAFGPQPGSHQVQDQQPFGQPQPRNTVDLVISIVLMVLLVLLSAATSFVSLFVMMLTDSCSDGSCDTDGVGLGLGVTLAGPWVVTAVGITATIIFLLRRKLAFGIPIVAGVLAFSVFWYGLNLVESAVS